MATTLAEVVRQVVAQLNDKNYVTWDADDIYSWIFQAEQAIGSIRPAALSITETMTLTAGCKQVMPAGRTGVLALHYNVVAGNPDRAVRRTDLRKLDAYNPTWRTATPSNVIKEYDFSDDDPTVFWVNPPAGNDAHLEGCFMRDPEPYSDPVVPATDTVTVKDVYVPVLVARVCYLALSGDNENTPNYAKAQSFNQEFYHLLGAKMKADVAREAKV